MPEPILDLSTVVPERQTVRIDGKPYDLAERDDLSLEERRELQKAWQRVLELETEGKSKTDNLEYGNQLRKVAKLLLVDCPARVVNKLSRSGQEAIAYSFFSKPNPRLELQMKQMIQSIGDSQSLASNGSTDTPELNGLESPSDG